MRASTYRELDRIEHGSIKKQLFWPVVYLLAVVVVVILLR